MANDLATRFVRNLFAACPKYRATKEMREDTISLYVDKLSKWRLPAKAWEEALDKIIALCEGELPDLAVIYGQLKAVTAVVSDEDEIVCMMFDRDGVRYALGRDSGRVDPHTHKRIFELVPVDPAHPPVLPLGASNPKIVIPPKMQAATEPCSPDEARGAFLRGWLQSGASGNKCMEMFKMLNPQAAGKIAEKADELAEAK